MPRIQSDFDYNLDYRDIEIVKFKIELVNFIRKMQSVGFLETVDCEEITSDFEEEKLI